MSASGKWVWKDGDRKIGYNNHADFLLDNTKRAGTYEGEEVGE